MVIQFIEQIHFCTLRETVGKYMSHKISVHKINITINLDGLQRRSACTCVCVWLVCKRVSNSILSINNDVTWHDSIWIVHNYLWIVQLVTNLSINTVEASRWTCQLLTVCLKLVLSSWTHVTEEHCSAAIGSLRVIMTFGRVGSKVKPMAESLKGDVHSDHFTV